VELEQVLVRLRPNLAKNFRNRVMCLLIRLHLVCSLFFGAVFLASHPIAARELAYPKLKFAIVDLTPQMRDARRIPTDLGTAMIGDVEDRVARAVPNLYFGLIITHVQDVPVANAQQARDEVARVWLRNDAILRLRVRAYPSNQLLQINAPFRIIQSDGL
jgi:hypothetical protein